MKSSTVTIPSGTMEYVSFGNGRRNLIVLPGLSDGLATVKGKAFLLSLPYRKYSQDFTVWMFSRRNQLPPDITIVDMADDQVHACRTLGIQKTAVLGVSQGGMIAQSLALRHPSLVEAMVLAVTAPSANDTVLACMGRWKQYAEKNDHGKLMIDTAEHSYSEAALTRMRRFYPALSRVGKPKTYDRFLANIHAIEHFDVRDDLKNIHCPVLILGGLLDQIVGKDASGMLHEAIPGSELYVYPQFGHGLYEEADDFYERVFSFLKRCEKS